MLRIVVPALVLARSARTSTVWLVSSNGAVDALVALERADVEPAAWGRRCSRYWRPAEQLEELDGVRGPAGDVAGQLLEHRQRALAAAVVDRLRDVGAGADRDRRAQVRAAQVGEQRVAVSASALRPRVVEEVVRDEIADIRDDPVAAGLDEEVVPEAARRPARPRRPGSSTMRSRACSGEPLRRRPARGRPRAAARRAGRAPRGRHHASSPPSATSGDVAGGVLDDRELGREDAPGCAGSGRAAKSADVRLQRGGRAVGRGGRRRAVAVGRILGLQLVDVRRDARRRRPGARGRCR